MNIWQRFSSSGHFYGQIRKLTVACWDSSRPGRRAARPCPPGRPQRCCRCQFYRGHLRVAPRTKWQTPLPPTEPSSIAALQLKVGFDADTDIQRKFGQWPPLQFSAALRAHLRWTTPAGLPTLQFVSCVGFVALRGCLYRGTLSAATSPVLQILRGTSHPFVLRGHNRRYRRPADRSSWSTSWPCRGHQ